MALENREGGKYITILGGKFCQRVQPSVEGSVERVNKLGKVVHEKFYDSFQGFLKDIKVTESKQYGKSWVFDFQDEGEVYHLQLSYSNSFATALLKMLPNIDVTKKMKVSPSVKEIDGKNKSSLFISQDGVNIKHAFTMDNPNGLPQMAQKKVKGQDVWDDTDRIEFLYNMVKETILPKLSTSGSKGSLADVSEKASSDEEEF